MTDRIFVVTKRKNGLQRKIAWFSKHENGIYFGVLALLLNSHTSYHVDGSIWRTSPTVKKEKIGHYLSLADFEGGIQLGTIMIDKKLIDKNPLLKKRDEKKARTIQEVDLGIFPSEFINIVIEFIEPKCFKKINERFQPPENAETVEPYIYQYPTTMPTDEKKLFQERCEKIQITHYSIFCELAGSHFQLRELIFANNITNNEKYFKKWEHFEVGYLHLGSVFYLVEVLWNILFHLIGASRQKFGEEFLLSIGEKKLAEKLVKTRENVKTIRDLMVHRGRAFNSLTQGDEFYIPYNVDKNMMWSKSIDAHERTEITKRLKWNIIQTELLLNDLHELFIDKYEKLIESNNITIIMGANNDT